MSHTFTIYIFNKLEEIFPSWILVSQIPSWPWWFLANILLLFLAGDVVPEPVGSDPGAVLVVVGVVWLASSEVREGEGRAVNPGELTLI